jgi:hypothetical protein
MPPRLQSAAYRCPVLVEKLFAKDSATYHSPLYRSQSEKPYFMAWPDLGGDPNQPSCLTTLMRARYVINRGTLIELEAVAAGAIKYLSCQDSIEPKVREVALAIIKHHQALWRYLPKFTNYPPIILGIDHITGFKLKEPEEFFVLNLALEAAIQGLIYGNLIHIREGQEGKGNLFGVKDAFSIGHETGHDLARRCHCGHVLDVASLDALSTLLKLAEDNLSPEQITEEWSKFWAINDCIYRLAEKFEPIEEIFANYVGLRFSPINVRNEVEALIKDHLIENKWIEAYNAFADVCDNADEQWFTAAFLIIDAVSRMITRFDFLGIDIGPAESAANLLHNFVEILKIIWSTFIEDIDDEDAGDLSE